MQCFYSSKSCLAWSPVIKSLSGGYIPWHAKWTDLSRVVCAHWGSTNDPSSLASVGKISNCPTPSDLRKVDFFEGSHLVNLTLNAHILVFWE